MLVVAASWRVVVYHWTVYPVSTSKQIHVRLNFPHWLNSFLLLRSISPHSVTESNLNVYHSLISKCPWQRANELIWFDPSALIYISNYIILQTISSFPKVFSLGVTTTVYCIISLTRLLLYTKNSRARLFICGAYFVILHCKIHPTFIQVSKGSWVKW